MNAKELVEKMNIYTLSSVRIYDLATSAHKLQWPINSDKPPRLKIDLPKSEDPIAVDASAEFEMTVGLLYFQGEDGMTMLPHENKLMPIERIIATQIMLYNYCLLVGLPHFGGQSDKGQFKFDWALIVQGGM